MNEACQLALNFILGIINAIPESPLMWLFGLAIILSIFSLLFKSYT